MLARLAARIGRRGVADESGAVLLLMALMLPVIVLLLAMSMDFGNWYVHQRQFENRVKAGSLAAGVAYGTNFANCLSSNPATRQAADSAIRDAALQYAGAGPGDFNRSASDASDGIVITVSNDPCSFHPPNPADPYSPLGGYWTDVAATAAEVPSFFSGFGVPRPTIGASSRVGLMQPDGGMRPFAITDPAAATCVKARWNSGSAAGEVPLNFQGGRWVGDAPGWPGNNSDLIFSIQVGCRSNSPTYTNMAYVTRLPRNGLTGLTLAPDTPGFCNANAYFIPRTGPSCAMTLRATFATAPIQPVRATIGDDPPAPLVGSGTTRTLSFQIAPGSGSGPNRSEPIVIERRVSPNNWVEVARTSVQAGRRSNQGPIANLTVVEHAPANAGQIGEIAVTLRSLSSNDLIAVDAGVDCDPAAAPSLEATFTGGCTGPFRLNTAPSGCANSAGGDPPPTLAGPFDCVGGIGSGTSLTSLVPDYNALWAPGTSCTPNRWPNVPAGDPRLVTVFLTDTIPDTPSPADDYPITGFAAFYVTGWDGQPSRCGDNDAAPDDETPPGSVWGHVLRNYVLSSSEGTGSDTPCNVAPVTLCIPVLVK